MLKKLLIFSLAVIMTAGFTSCGGETEAERERREALEELEQHQLQKEKDARISLEEYNDLSLGDYQGECELVIGGHGKQISEEEIDVENGYKVVSVYEYEGLNSGKAILKFETYTDFDDWNKSYSGKLISKTQDGLS